MTRLGSVTINYVRGDATQHTGSDPRVLVHVCNDVGKWGKGFVLSVSRRWPGPEREYLAWYRGEGDCRPELGAVQFVEVEPWLWVANLIGQRDIRIVDGIPPVRYEAIRVGMESVAEFALKHQASVHMPRIGCGLAGGDWREIEPILLRSLYCKGISTTVYDFG